MSLNFSTTCFLVSFHILTVALWFSYTKTGQDRLVSPWFSQKLSKQSSHLLSGVHVSSQIA